MTPLRSFFVAPRHGIRRLRRRDIAITAFTCPHLGHEMNRQSLDRAADYLCAAFGEVPPAVMLPSAPAAA
jgi:hypothetical protein